jgi:hypothetical protein
LKRVRAELLAARERIMREGNYVYQPVPSGPQPERFVI